MPGNDLALGIKQGDLRSRSFGHIQAGHLRDGGVILFILLSGLFQDETVYLRLILLLVDQAHINRFLGTGEGESLVGELLDGIRTHPA